jgi:presenilin-like A22 family membrane protease
LGGFLSFIWIFHPSLVTLNYTALVVAAIILLAWKDIPLKMIVSMAVIITAYDIYAIFYSNIMIELSEKMVLLPACLIFPVGHFSDYHLILIGLGDIVFPGTVVIYAFRNARRIQKIIIGYITLLGYLLGHLVCFTLIYYSQVIQPGTIYLYPSSLLGLFISIFAFKQWHNFFAKPKAQN